MKSRMKKTLGFLTVLCLAAGILPLSAVPAFADTAAGTGKAMQLVGTDNPSGGIADQDHIYLGTKDDTHYTWADAAPYWRVLDADKMNTGDAGMFVLSESLIGDNPGGDCGNIYFNLDKTKGNAWQGSDARNWCGSFLTNVFSEKERTAIASTNKDDYEYKKGDYNTKFSASSGILNGDKVFFLSVQEADSAAYEFENNASRIANYGNEAGYWWLRSPSASYDDCAGFVHTAGRIADNLNVNGYLAARPAFNLNLSSVLLTSAAVDGKLSGTAGEDALTEVSAYTGSDWKLTLKDSSHSGFTAAFDSRSGDVVTIKYSGTKAGTNEYISAVIVNSSGEITRYGHLALAETGNDKTVTVNLAGKYNDGDTLYVFNEQANGNKKTDYSSELKKIAVPAKKISLTITVRDQTYVYNGNIQGPGDTVYEDAAEIAEVISVEGLQGNDTITSVEIDGQASEIGEHKGVLKVTGFLINNDINAKERYNVILVPGNIIIKEEPVPPKPHVHDLTLMKAREATCTEAGSKAYYECGTCGRWFEDLTANIEITDKSSVIIKALGHDWDGGAVTKEPTYDEKGVRTYTCRRDSSHTKTEEIPEKQRISSGGSGRDEFIETHNYIFGYDPDHNYWYCRDKGTLLKDSWAYVPYNGRTYWYHFDGEGRMQTGWLTTDEGSYYLWPVSDGWMGRMVTGWQEIEGRLYYFETEEGKNQGRMYRNERTPDGHWAGPDGSFSITPEEGRTAGTGGITPADTGTAVAAAN